MTEGGNISINEASTRQCFTSYSHQNHPGYIISSTPHPSPVCLCCSCQPFQYNLQFPACKDTSVSDPKPWEGCLTRQMFVPLFRGTWAGWSTRHTGTMWSSIKCTAKNHTARLVHKTGVLSRCLSSLTEISFLPFFTGITRHFTHTCAIKNSLVATPSCPFKFPSIAVVSSVASTCRTLQAKQLLLLPLTKCF